MTPLARAGAPVVVVGGHNGLVAACYLARAGRRVLVLEAGDKAAARMGRVLWGETS